MAFPGKQARGRIQPDPAGTGQIDFAPGVQVGEIGLGTGRAIERLLVGGQLDQVAGHEARCQPQVAQQLHQQPGRIAAGAGLQFQRFFRRLHAGFHADGVADVIGQLLVQRHQEIGAADLLARNALEELFEQRRQRQLLPVGHQFILQVLGILEGKLLGIGFEEEIEGIDDRHLGHQVDLDLEFGGLLREHQARQVVRFRVLLPVDEVRLGQHAQRIAQDAGTAVRGGTQADDLRTQVDGTVVLVRGDMVQGHVDRHGIPLRQANGQARGLVVGDMRSSSPAYLVFLTA